MSNSACVKHLGCHSFLAFVLTVEIEIAADRGVTRRGLIGDLRRGAHCRTRTPLLVCKPTSTSLTFCLARLQKCLSLVSAMSGVLKRHCFCIFTPVAASQTPTRDTSTAQPFFSTACISLNLGPRGARQRNYLVQRERIQR